MENKNEHVDKIMLHRVYKLALEYYEKESGKIVGLCNIFNDLRSIGKITSDEMHLAKKHLRSQKPTTTLHKEFYDHDNYNKFHGAFWWRTHSNGFMSAREDLMALSEATNQRKLFLKKMIIITRSKFQEKQDLKTSKNHGI